MKYLGKKILVETIGVNGPSMTRGRIQSVEFHKELGPVFTAISHYGNQFRVTKREIFKIIN
jgi:hypothetical protein